MMVKDDYEAFCDVADRAAGVKFQEMHLIFLNIPDPLADVYHITIQVCFCLQRATAFGANAHGSSGW
jgi:hypothetical protein